MKDGMKPCEHALSEDIEYKEVVVIGNGPSGMVTSFMLAGNVPYLKDIPDDLPIDDMLRARLSNLPKDQSLYDTDLTELAEGLEGRSQNPISLLMDNLLRPCADLGLQSDSLIEWKYDVEKQIDHIVLGRGPPGGAWHTFPASVRTLSPGAWLTLPPHAPRGAARLSARAVAHYCRRYVRATRLQRYFRCGVVVQSVRRAPPAGPRCGARACPRNANYLVSGYELGAGGRRVRYLCARVALACGGGGRPNALEPLVARHAVHSLAALERALPHVQTEEASSPPTVVVVGSGLSAADAVRCARAAGMHVRHVHRAPAAALARLEPHTYPDYCQVYKMMCDGPTGDHPNYTPHPSHVIVDVSPLRRASYPAVTPKRVSLLNLATNETETFTAAVIAVFIGSKPDLSFLQTNFNLNCIDLDQCPKCEDTKHAAKRKIDEKQCFLKNHWHYLKSVLGQSIQSCKSRYQNYCEINGNDATFAVTDQKQRETTDKENCRSEVIDVDPFASGLGFGLDPSRPVDCRANPVAVDKSSHELLCASGLYALGPLTADNFVRFIPGGALAAVAHVHRARST